MDTIRVKGIVCLVHLGVEERERSQPQKVLVDVELGLELDAAANTDELDLSVDYERLAGTIRQTAAARPWRLVEALAGRLCQVVLSDPKIQRTRVTVRKFPARMEGVVDCVEVALERC